MPQSVAASAVRKPWRPKPPQRPREPLPQPTNPTNPAKKIPKLLPKPLRPRSMPPARLQEAPLQHQEKFPRHPQILSSHNPARQKGRIHPPPHTRRNRSSPTASAAPASKPIQPDREGGALARHAGYRLFPLSDHSRHQGATRLESASPTPVATQERYSLHHMIFTHTFEDSASSFFGSAGCKRRLKNLQFKSSFYFGDSFYRKIFRAFQHTRYILL